MSEDLVEPFKLANDSEVCLPKFRAMVKSRHMIAFWPFARSRTDAAWPGCHRPLVISFLKSPFLKQFYLSLLLRFSQADELDKNGA